MKLLTEMGEQVLQHPEGKPSSQCKGCSGRCHVQGKTKEAIETWRTRKREVGSQEEEEIRREVSCTALRVIA